MDVRQQYVGSSGVVDEDAVIARARDVLVEWFELPTRDAEVILRTWSRRSGIPLRTVAVALSSDIYEGTPSGCTPKVLRQLEQCLRELSCSR